MRSDLFTLIFHVMILIFGGIAAVFDIKTRRIPNKLVLVMLAAWILAVVPKLFLDIDAAVAHMVNSILGFLIGGGLFVLVYLLSRKGLGGGDVKFMAVSGLYIGFGGAISTIFIGSVLAAITGGALILFKKIKRKDPIPLVPFLFAGILVTVLLQG